MYNVVAVLPADQYKFPLNFPFYCCLRDNAVYLILSVIKQKYH